MNAYAVTLVGLLACGLMGCSGDRLLTRADQSVAEAKRAIDDSVDRAEQKIDRTVESTTVRLQKTIDSAQTAYAASVDKTGEEVDRLRTELKGDLADLDHQMEIRLEQIRSSAASLIAQGDKAAQERIDQVFKELREFSSDTLKRVGEMIEPINKMATSIGATSDAATKLVERLVLRIEAMMDRVNQILLEVTNFVMKLQGKNSDGTKSGTDWGAVAAAVLAGLGGIMGLLKANQANKKADDIQQTRASERSRDGDRWKPEEIDQRIEEKMAVKMAQMGVKLPPPQAPLLVTPPVEIVGPPTPPAATPDHGLDPSKGPK